MTQLAPVSSPDPDPVLGVLDTEEAWAAGLFEGEGSFGMRRNGTVLLALSSTDRDVIDRFAAVVRTGRISSRPAGERRRKRADEVISVLDARIQASTFERICPFCDCVFRPPFTPNASRTRFCSRLCERRWHSREGLLKIGKARAA